MGKNTFVQLAQKWDPARCKCAGMYMSEKLDGMRALWDGGITRGMIAHEVPWAYADKHARFRTPPKATGLWSRLRQPIQAPDWFLNQLPSIPLDGELWAGRGRFQFAMSACRKQVPQDHEWKQIWYYAFDAPSYSSMFTEYPLSELFIEQRVPRYTRGSDWMPMPFEDVVQYRLFSLCEEAPNIKKLDQHRLPYDEDYARSRLEGFLNDVRHLGGEGVMLREPRSVWTPERVRHLLKVKPAEDGEGVVIGYTWGRETDKGSKLLGKMGAAILRLPNGLEFELSGFTHEERAMRLIGNFTYAHKSEEAYREGCAHPGEKVSDMFENPLFPRGTTITFTYRELTDRGIPKEARYLRKRDSLE